MRTLSLITIVLLLLASNYSMANAPPIRIALVGPFTGRYAAYGTQILSGAMQAVQDINAQDGLKGIALEIVPIDDQCDPEIAVTQAEKIIAEQKYNAVIGHVCSACTLATMKLYAKANILVITPTSTNPRITQQGIATLFRMTGTDKQQATEAANFIANKLRSKRVAVLHDQELYSKEMADNVSENLLRLNTTPVLYQAVPRGTRNFTHLVKKLKQLKADAVYFAGLYPEVSSLAKALHVLELQVPLVSGDGIALQQFVTDVGGPRVSNAIILSFVTEPKNLLSSKTVIHRMQQKKLETTGYALYAYATVEVLAAAILGANQTSANHLANWLHHHEVETVLGKKSWDTNGDINGAEFKMYNWRGDATLEILAS